MTKSSIRQILGRIGTCPCCRGKTTLQEVSVRRDEAWDEVYSCSNCGHSWHNGVGHSSAPSHIREIKKRSGHATVETSTFPAELGDTDHSHSRAKLKIPPGERTRPMSLTEAAKLMGYPGAKKQRAKRLRRLIDDGSIAYEKLGRQQYVFSKNMFSQDVWPHLDPLRFNSR